MTEKRPWGEFTTHLVGNGYKVKTFTVLPGQRLSLQSHNHRNEFWIVAEGSAYVEVGNSVSTMTVGSTVYIGVEEKHRVTCIGDTPCTILELQYGNKCVEEDIIRYEDDYARK